MEWNLAKTGCCSNVKSKVTRPPKIVHLNGMSLLGDSWKPFEPSKGLLKLKIFRQLFFIWHIKQRKTFSSVKNGSFFLHSAMWSTLRVDEIEKFLDTKYGIALIWYLVFGFESLVSRTVSLTLSNIRTTAIVLNFRGRKLTGMRYECIWLRLHLSEPWSWCKYVCRQ